MIDIHLLRGLATVLVMIVFIGICWWAFAPRRKQRFDEAANLPFADEEQHRQAQKTAAKVNSSGNMSKRRQV